MYGKVNKLEAAIGCSFIAAAVCLVLLAVITLIIIIYEGA